MRNVKIILQYDGTNYHGWQFQPGLRTIQGEVTRALSLLDCRPVTVHGAGRTDAGVHAKGQVANFLMERDAPHNGLLEAINGNLDPDIRVVHMEFIDDRFHARFSAKQKTYQYRIWNAKVVSPFDLRYVYHYRSPLDLARMREGAAILAGTHDFKGFTVCASESIGSIRTIKTIELETRDEMITLTATANGFLRYMVRTIAGTLIDIGRGYRSVESLKKALEHGHRPSRGKAAPASGLTLLRVDY